MAKAKVSPSMASMDSLFGEETATPRLIAGVDEAGRGPLAGPVCAAAVILDPAQPIEGLNDSKQLSEKARDRLAPLIKERALAWAIAWSDAEEIDRINILQATLTAMKRAVEGLTVKPELCVIDGNKVPPSLGVEAVAIPKADATYAEVSAASILAKTARDALMKEMDAAYPGYGFAQHAGYGTKAHMEAIASLGVTPIHRKTFRPIAERLAQDLTKK